MVKSEIRVRLNNWMSNALYQLSRKTGMDYTNLTRMALMEYLERRLHPADYENINYIEHKTLRDAIFEFDHYKRVIKKFPDKKSNKFKKLFVVSLQNYKKLGHTHIEDYKTNINRFNEVIWKEPGVIDLLIFMTKLDQSPLPDKDRYENLIKNGKDTEYYNKKWNEIYDNLKNRIGRKKFDNYARLVELKIDYGLVTDTDTMYFLFEKLKNNEPLPPSSGKETKNLVDCSTIDEGSLEELIKKYGSDFKFIKSAELEDIAKNYANLAEIDNWINHYQGQIDAEENYYDKSVVEFAKKMLIEWKQLRKKFMDAYKNMDSKKKIDKTRVDRIANQLKKDNIGRKKSVKK